MELRMKKLRNSKVADKEEVIGEMIRGGGDLAIEWGLKIMQYDF